MVSGIVYTFKLNHTNVWGNKILITANTFGSAVKFADQSDGFTHGVTDKKDDFKSKFPFFKYLAFEGENHIHLTDCDAILLYLSGEDLKLKPEVHQLMNIADRDLHMAMATLCYPALGLIRPDKIETAEAILTLNEILAYLDSHLEGKKFLFGQNISIADISVFCELVPLYEMYLDQSYRSKYPKLIEWINCCMSMKSVSSAIGQLIPCKKPSGFNNDLYLKYHKIETKPVKQVVKKNVTEKPCALKVEEKPKVNTCPFSVLPPTKFDQDEWKRVYSNNDAVSMAIPWLWKNLDYDGFSFWYGKYKYDDELAIPFMISNLINGFFSRIEGLRKYSFGVFYLAGTGEKGSGNYELSCVWLHRGNKLAFELNPDWNQDAYLYDFHKLDVSKAEDKETIENHFALKDNIMRFPLYDSFVFK